MEKFDLDSVLAANPSISREDVDRVRDMTKALRDLGLKRRGYRIATPPERQQVRTGCEGKLDPRAIRLSRT